MAQIEDGGGNGKGKSHQKKMTIRVDFTPMVDMNMLLITFFMLCTTMIKTQTMNIALPSNNTNLKEEQKNQASKDDAVTLILDVERNAAGEVQKRDGKVIPVIYYYVGMPTEIDGEVIISDPNANNVVVQMPSGKEKIVKANFDLTEGGIRSFIKLRNEETIKRIDALRDSIKKANFKDAAEEQAKFNERAKEIRNAEDIEHKPVIIIKATDDASYGSLVSILDEMQINQIAKYQIDNLNAVDEALLKDYRSRHK